MSDAVQIALITGITATVPPLLIGVLNYLNGRKRDKADVERDKLAKSTHTLVNSQMGDTLFVGMVAARTLAKSIPTAENKILAQAAEAKYTEHQAKQATVDAA